MFIKCFHICYRSALSKIYINLIGSINILYRQILVMYKNSLSERNVYCWILDTVEWEIYLCSILQMYGIIEKIDVTCLIFLLAGDGQLLSINQFSLYRYLIYKFETYLATFNKQSEQQNCATLKIDSGKLHSVFLHLPLIFRQFGKYPWHSKVIISISQILCRSSQFKSKCIFCCLRKVCIQSYRLKYMNIYNHIMLWTHILT